MKKRIVSILIILSISIVFSSCEKKQTITSPTSTLPTATYVPAKSIENFYKVLKEKDNSYTVVLYDKDKKVVQEDKFPKEPYVNVLDKDIIQITISLGSPNNYTYFFDTKTSKISEIYNNVLLVEKGKVVFMQVDKLIVSDMFDRGVLYKEIKKNFSPIAVSSSAIIKVEFMDSNKLMMQYIAGNDFKEKTEIVNLSE